VTPRWLGGKPRQEHPSNADGDQCGHQHHEHPIALRTLASPIRSYDLRTFDGVILLRGPDIILLDRVDAVRLDEGFHN
jgi:hypothetical protein